MAYQPTFASPYLTSIDVDTVGGNNFKCLINPRDTIEKYKINIYSVLDNNLVCYVRGEIVDGEQKKWYKSGDADEVSVDISGLIEESVLPLKGSLSDEAWLIVNIPENIGLLNGVDYKWNIELWGDNADVQVAMPSGGQNANASYIWCNTMVSGVETGMFAKYNNELREIIEVETVINEEDETLNYSRLWLTHPFSETTIEGWFAILDKKVTSFDYYFKARVEPKINLEELVPDTIESNRLYIEDNGTANSEGILITKNNITDYFYVYKDKSTPYYFEGYNSAFVSNNHSIDGSEALSTTAITRLTAKQNIDNLSLEIYTSGFATNRDNFTLGIYKLGTSGMTTEMTLTENTMGYWSGSVKRYEKIEFNYWNGGDQSERDRVVITNFMINKDAIEPEASSIEFYKFDLYLKDELIHTTNEVYSSDLRYDYNGLLSDNEYTLRLTIGIGDNETITQEKSFNVKYEKYNAMINPVATNIPESSCIKIDFSKNSHIGGVLEGTDETLVYTEYKNGTSSSSVGENNGINLSRYQSIYWNNFNDNSLNLEDTTQIIHWHPHSGFYGTIFEKIDEANPSRDVLVGYNGEAFYYKIGTNDIVYWSPYTNYPDYLSAINQTNLDSEMLYKLNDSDVLEDTDIIATQDIANMYWWLIIIKSDCVEFKQSLLFSDTEVV